MISALKAAVREHLRDLPREPTVILVGFCFLITVSHYQGSTRFFRSVLNPFVAKLPFAGAMPYFWWFGCSVILYFIAPLLLAYVTGGQFTRKYGLGLGDWRAGLKISLLFVVVMLPIVIVAAKTTTFGGHYPLAGAAAYRLQYGTDQATPHLGLFVLYEAAYLAYFVAWEFMFRGWMLNGLLTTFGRSTVLIQTVPFALLHFGKPQAETFGSIIAGLALGVLALRTRSFWYGALLHAAIAITMDVAAAWTYL